MLRRDTSVRINDIQFEMSASIRTQTGRYLVLMMFLISSPLKCHSVHVVRSAMRRRRCGGGSSSSAQGTTMLCVNLDDEKDEE